MSLTMNLSSFCWLGFSSLINTVCNDTEATKETLRSANNDDENATNSMKLACINLVKV